MVKIVIASDEAGFECKGKINIYLKNFNFIVNDVGYFSEESIIDYPFYCKKLVKKIQKHEISYGILVCGSGIGVSMCANRYKHVRAAACYTEEMAKLAREHNDANVLCIGARLLSQKSIEKIIKMFFSTKFSTDTRHIRRIEQFNHLGEDK